MTLNVPVLLCGATTPVSLPDTTSRKISPILKGIPAYLKKNIVTGFFLSFMIFLMIPVSAANDPCSLSVGSIPQGAYVLVDGIGYGDSPLTDITVSCEPHTIGVQMQGFANYSSAVSFENVRHHDIMANLQRLPDKGQVTILSEPPGGDLFVDGKARGVTPCTVDNLERGRHEILIKKPGYEDYHDALSVVTDQTLEYTEYLVPLPGTGFLSVISSPEGAEVTIDGRLAGTTPTNLQRISAGNHTVEMYKDGYWNFSGIVTVKGGEAMLANADLVRFPTTCTLYLDSSPQGQGIFLNDIFKGFTPMTLDTIPPGDYVLRMNRPQNGGSVNQSFRFNRGATYEIFADLSNSSGGSIIHREWLYRNETRMKNQKGWVSVNTTPVIERTYTWYTKGHEATITLDIPQDLYDYYKNQTHPVNVTPEMFSSYAIKDKDRQYIHTLVNRLKDASDSKSYSGRNDYHNVVAFVQSVEYINDLDPVTKQLTEYPKYPIETLADGKGDCEDTAILTAALLKEMGYDVAIVLPTGHAAVAVACDNCNGYYYPLNGKRYYYLETTGSGYSLGTMDKKYQTTGAKIIPF